MAQYTDNNGFSETGRAFVVSAPEIRVITPQGEVRVLLDGEGGGGGVVDHIEKETTETSYSLNPADVEANSALVVKNTSLPATDSSAVVPTTFVQTVIGDPVKPSAGNIDPGHVIGLFNSAQVYKNTGTVFGQEFRIDPRANTLAQYVATKHVVGPDNQNQGTIGTYVLEQLDDMRGSVNKVGSFLQAYLDPRLLTVHRGGKVGAKEQLNASKTLTNLDSGKSFMCVNNAPITITIGEDVLEGAEFHFIQATTNKLSFAVHPSKAWYAKASRVETDGQFAECTVRVYPFGGTVGTFTSAS